MFILTFLSIVFSISFFIISSSLSSILAEIFSKTGVFDLEEMKNFMATTFRDSLTSSKVNLISELFFISS
jgi:hypothetical protein